MQIEKKLVRCERTKDTGLVVKAVMALNCLDKNKYIDRTLIGCDFDGDPKSPNFIPFDDLTVQEIIDWIVAKKGVEFIEEKEEALLLRVSNREKNPYIDGLPKQDN